MTPISRIYLRQNQETPSRLRSGISLSVFQRFSFSQRLPPLRSAVSPSLLRTDISFPSFSNLPPPSSASCPADPRSKLPSPLSSPATYGQMAISPYIAPLATNQPPSNPPNFCRGRDKSWQDSTPPLSCSLLDNWQIVQLLKHRICTTSHSPLSTRELRNILHQALSPTRERKVLEGPRPTERQKH